MNELNDITYQKRRNVMKVNSKLIVASVLFVIILLGFEQANGEWVTFSCDTRGTVIVTVIGGPQGGLVCSPNRSSRTIELDGDKIYSISTSCAGSSRCRFFINIDGGEFLTDGLQTDGSLSPGDSTGARFRVKRQN